MSTELEVEPLDPVLQQLARSNEKVLFININDSKIEEIVGHQYLLLAFPFGRVRLKDSGNSLFSAVASSVALAGYKPLLAASDEESRYPLLNLDLQKVQVSAFDLLALRKIVVKFKARATLNMSETEKKIIELENSEQTFKQFAFKKQLSFFWQRTLNKALSELSKALSDERLS